MSIGESNNTGSAIAVTYGVSGTATSGTDYPALSGSVSIGNGASSPTIRVQGLDNVPVAGSETVVVTLTGPTSGSFVVDTGNDGATVTISAYCSG